MASDALLRGTLLEILQDYVTESSGILQVGLYTADISPNPNTAGADLTAAEPVGTWYNRQTITYFTPFANVDGSYQVEAQDLIFTYAGVSAGETIHGWFVAQNSGGAVFHAARLDAPILMDDVEDSIIVEPSLNFLQVLQS